MSLAVVGTGTEIGKTVVSALVCASYGQSRPLAYWKPIASGSIEDRDTHEVRRLTGGAVEILPETYLFERPLSPHLAARLEERRVEPEAIRVDLARHRDGAPARALVVEGIGGVLVPLTDEGYLWTDLLEEIGLPCLVAALSTLGTINHTLLTLEALRRRGIEIAGVVLNGPADPENRRAIERFGGVEVIGELPRLEPLTRDTLGRAARGFDPDGRLRRHLERA